MEFNQLPEGYEGPQRRRTNFASPREKLAYDADNLIALAKKTPGKEKVSVRDILKFATRNDDALKTVREAIAIRLTTMPYFAEAGLTAAENIKRELTPEQQEELLARLKARFEANMNRHEDIEWANVQAKLEASPEKMLLLNEMERTGGEPDVVRYDQENNEYIFFDCFDFSDEPIDVQQYPFAYNKDFAPNNPAHFAAWLKMRPTHLHKAQWLFALGELKLLLTLPLCKTKKNKAHLMLGWKSKYRLLPRD